MRDRRTFSELLLRTSVKKVVVHNCIEELCAGESSSLERMVEEKADEQVTMLVVSDGFFLTR